MEIKELTLNDDLSKVAELIYLTDNYIFPYWFDGYNNWKELLVDLIKTKGTVFYYKNIIVAKQNNQIIGFLIHIENKNQLYFNYENLINYNKNFNHTIKTYVLPLKKYFTEPCVYISNVTVFPHNRQHGVATALLTHLIKQFPNTKFKLHTVCANTPAIKLYTKLGFKKMYELKGFNAPYKRKPLIQLMELITK